MDLFASAGLSIKTRGSTKREYIYTVGVMGTTSSTCMREIEKRKSGQKKYTQFFIHVRCRKTIKVKYILEIYRSILHIYLSLYCL